MNSIYDAIPAQDPKAREIILSVMEGETSPEDGALRLKTVWFPIEGMQGSKQASFSSSRKDSVIQLNVIAVTLENNGQRTISRRLAELNYRLAEQIDDLISMVVSGATLIQVMSGDLASNKRRLELAEFVVPELKKLHTSEETLAMMLMHLTDARFLESKNRPSMKSLVIEAGNEALTHKDKLSRPFLARVFFILGTAYNELPASEENLNRSIQYFSQALLLYENNPGTSAEEYGALLNNLGNSYRDLGALTADSSKIKKALGHYQHILSEIDSPRYKELAKGNREKALEMLDTLQQQGNSMSNGFIGKLRQRFNKPASIPDKKGPSFASHQGPEQEFQAFLQQGDELFYEGQESEDDEEKEKNIKEAVRIYFEAIKNVDRMHGESDMARVLHRMGITFIYGTMDDDNMWTTFCFANAARRLAGADWNERGLARIDYHKAKALTVIGYPNHVEYLTEAVELLKRAMPAISTSDNSGEYKGVQDQYHMALSMLAACKGKGNAQSELKATLLEDERKRIADRHNWKDQRPIVRYYRAYFENVLKYAEKETLDRLADFCVERDLIIADDAYGPSTKTSQILGLAEKFLRLGDIQGVFMCTDLAERYTTELETISADEHRFQANAWLNIAEFYLQIPLPLNAKECLVRLASSIDPARLGGFFDEYEIRKERMANDIKKSFSLPNLNVKETAQLIYPNNAAKQKELALNLQTDAAAISREGD